MRALIMTDMEGAAACSTLSPGRPVRKRERVLQRLKSPAHVQQFLEPFSAVHDHFRPHRHLLSAHQNQGLRTIRFQQWREEVRLHPTA